MLLLTLFLSPTLLPGIESSSTSQPLQANHDSEDKKDLNHSQNPDEEEKEAMDTLCSVYLARSSVPGGGIGFFTTRAFQKGEIIHPADMPAIPIIDPDFDEQSLDAWINLFKGYWWDSGSSDATRYEASLAIDFQGVVGSFPNTHAILHNIRTGLPDVVPIDDTILNGGHINPGAGGYSINMGRHTIATLNIEPGEELFLEYPVAYTNMLSTKYDIPTYNDYMEALNRLSKILKTFKDKDVSSDPLFDSLLVGVASDKVKSLLPKNHSDLDRILTTWQKKNTGLKDSNENLAIAIANEMSIEKRSVDWLRENGLCVDNIVMKTSQNPKAGRGAFAQRPIRKGEIIVPAPTLQVTDKDAMTIPPFAVVEKDGSSDNNNPGKQLMLNYCFGHDESSLLLCPYSNALLLNHCSSRRPDLHSCFNNDDTGNNNTSPNAEYRWSESWDNGQTLEWLAKDIEDIKAHEGRVPLSFDIVATRNIEAGEELFLDYGAKWEAQWDRHLQDWYVPPGPEIDNDGWINAKEWNEQLYPLNVFSNVFFDDDEVENFLGSVTGTRRDVLFTGCLYNGNGVLDSSAKYWKKDQDPNTPWKSMSTKAVISRFGRPAKKSYDLFDDTNASYADGAFWPCIVMDNNIGGNENKQKDSDGDYYTVRIIQTPFQDMTVWEEMGLPRIITDFPRASIRHFYKPYASDIHFLDAFRRHVDIRDDIFPEKWKDRKECPSSPMKKGIWKEIFAKILDVVQSYFISE